MTVYYARPINLYNTPQDLRDIEIISKMGFEVINPNKDDLQKRYKSEGMVVFLNIIADCDGIVFRSFPCGSISAGVYKEIRQAEDLGKFVIELPSLLSRRILSIDDTREYLKLIGSR